MSDLNDDGEVHALLQLMLDAASIGEPLHVKQTETGMIVTLKDGEHEFFIESDAPTGNWYLER